jgi:8-oxo-dGTP pyrophosphatase MutT (NUDIX family)
VSHRADPPAPPAVPRHAATVILLREERGHIEVLLTRRHEKMSFMGGLWVFPGGTLCAADTSSAALALIPHPENIGCERWLDLEGRALPSSLCLGLSVAAHRETFEETGVLLAMTADGHDHRSDMLARIRARRHAIVSQPELFATLLQEEHLRIDIEHLIYWAHWITPSIAPKRFDTRFFLARLPPGQVATIDAIEATEMTWMTPAAALTAAHDGAMALAPPTLYSLMELDASVRRHVALDAIFSAETRRDIVPVMPKIAASNRRVIVMPWDAEYHDLPGVGVSREISYPQRFLALSSRISSDR